MALLGRMYPLKVFPDRVSADSWKIGQFRYFKIQLKTIDITTRLWGINLTNSIVYSPEPRADVYCLKLNINISKLGYLSAFSSRSCFSVNYNKFIFDDVLIRYFWMGWPGCKGRNQFLVLYPLAFVPLKKDGSCLSLRSFCFHVT